MAINNVSSFLSQIGQGVKPNMFNVDINFPTGLSDILVTQTGGSASQTELTALMCKSAALPGSNLGVIEVPFRGRTVKIAGDRTFDTWTATFFNDKDFKIRALFERWANEINLHEANTSGRFKPSTESDGYMADLFVTQLEKDGSESGSSLRTYKLHHCFPTNISSIDLAYDSNDQIEEFTVEWQYSFFTAQPSSGGSSIPASKSSSVSQLIVE
tara:strand:- start:77 stop:718 length:642 start_codon:yes stop_codon:yes gene_type:complete